MHWKKVTASGQLVNKTNPMLMSAVLDQYTDRVTPHLIVLFDTHQQYFIAGVR